MRTFDVRKSVVDGGTDKVVVARLEQKQLIRLYSVFMALPGAAYILALGAATGACFIEINDVEGVTVVPRLTMTLLGNENVPGSAVMSHEFKEPIVLCSGKLEISLTNMQFAPVEFHVWGTFDIVDVGDIEYTQYLCR